MTKETRYYEERIKGDDARNVTFVWSSFISALAFLTLVVITFICSCATSKDVVESIRKDSSYVSHAEKDSTFDFEKVIEKYYHEMLYKDSVFVRDSIYVFSYENGNKDTYHEKETYYYKVIKVNEKSESDSLNVVTEYVMKIDTIYSEKTDTIYKKVEVESKKTWWEGFCISYCGWFLGILIVLLGYKGIKIYMKYVRVVA